MAAAGAFGVHEHLWEWQQAIQGLRSAVELWAAIVDAERGEVDLEPSGSEAWSWPHHVLRSVRVRRSSRGSWQLQGLTTPPLRLDAWAENELKETEQHDALAEARVGLRCLINDRIRETVSVSLRRTDSTRHALRVVPTHLIGAIWLDFARATEGDLAVRRCEGCGGWIYLHPSFGSNKQAKTCSSTCRSRANRRLRNAARDMRRGGATLLEIAERLGLKYTQARKLTQDVPRGRSVSSDL